MPTALRFRCALLLFAAVPCARAADAPSGEQIFRKQCAACHGDKGEGTKDFYPRPLEGERSVAQLARLIGKTMPKDDPGTCTGDNADKVAAFVFDNFYSKAARERNQRPRIELSRLTVRQHQNAVADLVASFRTQGKGDEQHGLHGEYFSSRGFGTKQRVIDRLDAEVRFDFKESSPEPEKIKPEEFAVRWQGSVLATETGDYEFTVRSANGFRLWVNDNTKPLIDAWVRSGTDVVERGSLRLLGGRAYLLRLEFFKSKEAKEKTAAIALEWKPPHGVTGLIPVKNLTPNPFPETLLLETAFPPDDRSLGWERGTAISKAWDQAATDAALETAAYVTAHLGDLSGTRDGAADRPAKLRDFCGKFAERAFRRPLTAEQKRVIIDHQFETASDPETAVKRVVLLVLLSPRFLYREVGGPDAYDVASRLAFGLWDAPPDRELLDAAASGKLATRDQVVKQAERMLADPRAHAKLHDFLIQWLRVDQAPEIAKDAERFPGFDMAVVADLRTSLNLTLEDAVWTGDSDFRRLFLADDLYLNGRLAKFYGVELPADAGFQKVKLNPDQRAGILTHPYLLAAFAYNKASSPIHRGVFLTRGVLGVTLRPPPDAFTPLAESLHPDLTTRERVTLQTKGVSCQACHGVINPLGFPLEHFDAVGRYRERDNGKVINATGSYVTRNGDTVKFDGARDLAKFLASSDEVQGAFAEHLFQHVAKQPVAAYGPQEATDLRRSFAEHGYSVRSLLVEVVTDYALPGKKELSASRPPRRSGKPVPPGG